MAEAIADLAELIRRRAEESGVFEASEESLARDAVEQKRREDELAAKRLVDRGVPARLVELVMGGGVTDTKAIQAARQFVESDRQFLVLAGGVGCGKTVAAALVVHQLGGRFIDVSRLVRLSRYDDDQIRPYEECSLLAIDDLGMEYADTKGSFLATLDGLLNARYAAGLRTVITANLAWDAFRRRYGERIADRLKESGRYVEISDQSMRGRT